MSEKTESTKKILEMLNSIAYVQPGDIPRIDLYMDQVTTFMDQHLESSKRYSDDKLLTKTMINNYTKSELLPSPEKKKYSPDHMYLLLFIYYLKNILSISDTKAILNPLTEEFFPKKDSQGHYESADSDFTLEDIYAEIFKIEGEQAKSLAKDVLRKFEKSQTTFADVEDEDEKRLLQTFSFVSMLCFDVYMKKMTISRLIDFFVEQSGTGKKDDRKDRKDEKSDKKEDKKEERKKDNKQE